MSYTNAMSKLVSRSSCETPPDKVKASEHAPVGGHTNPQIRFILGRNVAKRAGLKIGDYVTVRVNRKAFTIEKSNGEFGNRLRTTGGRDAAYRLSKEGTIDTCTVRFSATSDAADKVGENRFRRFEVSRGRVKVYC